MSEHFVCFQIEFGAFYKMFFLQTNHIIFNYLDLGREQTVQSDHNVTTGDGDGEMTL